MDPLRRIRRLSTLMAVLCCAAAVLLPLALAGVWTWIEHVPASPELPVPPDALAKLTAIDRVGGFAIAMLPGGMAVWGLLILVRLFRRFGRGEILDARSAALLQRFAVAVLALVLLRPLAGALATMWVTRNNPPGERMLALSISDGEIAAALLGGLFLTIAWVLREAARVAEEHRQIV